MTLRQWSPKPLKIYQASALDLSLWENVCVIGWVT